MQRQAEHNIPCITESTVAVKDLRETMSLLLRQKYRQIDGHKTEIYVVVTLEWIFTHEKDLLQGNKLLGLVCFRKI